MILRGTQIQRRGHGKCGLLTDRVRSSNLTAVVCSAVVPLIAAHRDGRRLFSSPFEQRIAQSRSTARIIHQCNSLSDDSAKCVGRAEQSRAESPNLSPQWQEAQARGGIAL